MNIFKDGFVEPEARFPNEMVQEVVDNFENATGGLASLTVLEIDGIGKLGPDSLSNTFVYKVLLTSDYLPGYSFEIFKFGYDVTIYPTVIKLQSDIGKELGIEEVTFIGYPVFCEDENDLLIVMNKVFGSTKFRNTVGGLMKIARSKA